MRGPLDVSELFARTTENLALVIKRNAFPYELYREHSFFFFLFVSFFDKCQLFYTLESGFFRFKTVQCSISRAKYKEMIVVPSVLQAS